MKILSLTLIWIMLTVSGFCQIPDNAISIEDEAFNDCFFDERKIPTVRGKVLNVSKIDIEEARVKFTIVTPFDQRQITKYSSLNPDGTFELKLDHSFPYQQIWMAFGELFYAGIYAHTELYIELDAKILKSKNELRFNGPGVRYLGTDGEFNSYMNNHILFKRPKQLNISRDLSKLLSDRKIDFESYISKYDKLYSSLHELDQEYIEQNPSDFSWAVMNERQSDYYGNLCVKHWGKEMSPELFEKVKAHKSFFTSNSGMGFYNYFFTYLKYASSRGYKRDYASYKSYAGLVPEDVLVLDSISSMEVLSDNSEPYDTTIYLSLIKRAKVFLHDTLVVERTLRTTAFLDSELERPKADFLKTKITSRDPKVKGLQMAAVLDQSLTNWCRTVLVKRNNQNLKKLKSINEVLESAEPLSSDNKLGKAIAEMPFGAKMFHVDNMEANQLLANLKESFKGKALVIDFWATWCAPCLHEMPHSNKLRDDVKELPVEFVYLCTSGNSSLDQWNTKVAEYKLGGTHIFVDQKILSELMNMFSLGGFPSYIFIDKDGSYKPGAISRISHMDKEKIGELVR